MVYSKLSTSANSRDDSKMKLIENDYLGSGFLIAIKALLIILFGVKILVSESYSYELGDGSHLRAFSLSAAKTAITSKTGNLDEIYSIGFITKVWAVVLDDGGDLIIVGEADSSIPGMHLDDIVVALRTIDKISTGENPGVSIEPISFNKYHPFQKVIYYGGIDSTHYGRICYEADLLLKRLALGFEQTGIIGFPSEWDLSLDNSKSGRRLNPWERSVGRSWFFPLRVRIAHKNNCAAITAMTMEVKTDLDEELEIPREFLVLDTKTIIRTLKTNREAVSIIFARLFTQKYEEIASHFPVLVQLQNLLSLSGLLAELLKDATMKDFNYWRNEFLVENVNNNKKVQTLSRGVNGLGHSLFMSGGVFANYNTEDAWADAVLSRKPKFIKQAVLASRPSSATVSWVIPLEHGPPANWSDSVLSASQKIVSNKTFKMGEDKYQTSDKTIGLNLHTRALGWEPATHGKNLLAFKARFYFSSGGFEAFSPDGRFSVAGAEISTGVPFDFQLVFANRLELSLTIPLIFRIQFQDRPSQLPGLKNNLVAFACGIENPILVSRIQLLNGVKKGRWIYPSLVAENTVVIPTNYKVFEKASEEPDSGDPLSVRFGSDEWKGSHGFTMFVPISQNFNILGLGEFQTDWNGSTAGARILRGVAMNWLFEKEAGLSLGLHYRTSSIKKEINAIPAAKRNGNWISEGHQFFVSLSLPTRSGTNSIFLGWYSPNNQPNVGGTFLMSLDLGGTSLWDIRTWF